MGGTKKRLIPLVVVACGILTICSLLFAATGDGAGRWRTSTGRIQGQVRFPAPGPVSSVAVTLDGAVSVHTDAEGRFSFNLVPPGTHFLEVRHLAHRYQGSARVTVMARRLATAVLELREVPEVGATIGAVPLAEGYHSFSDLDFAGPLLVGCDAKRGFVVYDASNKASPRYLGSSPATSEGCDGVLLDLPYLYMGWMDYAGVPRGLAVLSLENPSSPREVSRLDVGANPNKMVHAAGLLYGIGNERFQIFDVRNPARPRLLSELPYRGEGIAYRDGLVFLGTEPSVLAVVDVSDPEKPAAVWESAEISPSPALRGKDCILAGRYLYVGRSDSLSQYDVLDPREPRLVNVVDVDYLRREGAQMQRDSLGTGRIDVRDWIAYLSGGDSGLIAVDYQDVLRPRFSWQSDAKVEFAMNVIVDENYVYLTTGSRGLRILRRR